MVAAAASDVPIGGSASMYPPRDGAGGDTAEVVRQRVHEELVSILPGELEGRIAPIMAELCSAMNVEMQAQLRKLQHDVGESQQQMAVFLANHGEASLRQMVDATLLPIVDSRFAMYDAMVGKKLDEIMNAARLKFSDVDAQLLTLSSQMVGGPGRAVEEPDTGTIPVPSV